MASQPRTIVTNPKKTKKINLRRYNPEHYSPDVIREFYRIKKSTMMIMKKRGFNVSQEESLPFFHIENIDNLGRFFEYYLQISKSKKISFATALNNIYDNGNPEDITVVYFFDRPIDVGVKNTKMIYTEQAKKFIAYLQLLKMSVRAKNFLLIIEVDFYSQARNAITSKRAYNFEIFKWSILLHGNTDRHKYVPKYTKLTSEQKRVLFNGFLPENLPKMHTIDPLSRLNGWKKGDVIKFEIFTPSTKFLIQKTVEYRLVI